MRFVVAAAAFSLLAPGQEQAVDELIRRRMTDEHIAGMTVAVVQKGQPAFVRGYGLCNLELEVPCRPESVFRIGSVSKQFIATGVMLLVAEAKLSLEAPLRTYFPEGPAWWDKV